MADIRAFRLPTCVNVPAGSVRKSRADVIKVSPEGGLRGWNSRLGAETRPHRVRRCPRRTRRTQRFSTLAGRPASSMVWATCWAVSGVSLTGLRTTVQPAAMAGATLRVATASGRFPGVMSSHGPAGLCWTRILFLPSGGEVAAEAADGLRGVVFRRQNDNTCDSVGTSKRLGWCRRMAGCIRRRALRSRGPGWRRRRPPAQRQLRRRDRRGRWPGQRRSRRRVCPPSWRR